MFFKHIMKFIVLSVLICTSLSARRYDYIIIGNGSAGAILARKLSDNFKKRVLVLEVGVNRNDDPIVLDPNIFTSDDVLNQLTVNPKYAVNYPVEFFFPLQTGNYPEGRGWGGSAMHNYLDCVHFVPGDTQFWVSASNNDRWSFANLEPKSIALEHFYSNGIAADTTRGTEGPISVTESPSIVNDPFAQAAVAATGTTFIPDYNSPLNPLLGFSAIQQFITPPPNSRRSFSGNEFLTPDVVSKRGRGICPRKLTILSNAVVSRIIFKGKRNPKAKAVEYFLSNNKEKVRKARGKTIILCAGSINTPAILQRSGIGDAALLESLGIKVVVNNSNVGEHLLNQYGASGILGGLGAHTTATPALQGFINGQPYLPNDPIRRLQFLGLNIGPNIMQILGFILHPRSEGSVKIVSRNPFIYPNVDLNMFSDGGVNDPNSDASQIVAFYKIMRDVAIASGSIVFVPTPLDFASDEGLLAIAKQRIAAESHASSTARMGTSIANGVVDGNLRVFGVRNLFIADMSIFPYLESGNTCWSAYIAGLVLADILGVPTPPAL